MTDITCETAVERMLEAAPAELRGEAGTELATHIAGCDRCRAVAAVMLGELEAVDDALAEYATGGPSFDADPGFVTDADNATDPAADRHAAADAVADAALAAIRTEADRDVISPDRRRRQGIRWTRAAWISLAAAAALAAVLVFGPDDPFSGPSMGPTQPAEPTIEPRVSVTPPADKGAAIMETENPNITIVWLYEREGT